MRVAMFTQFTSKVVYVEREKHRCSIVASREDV